MSGRTETAGEPPETTLVTEKQKRAWNRLVRTVKDLARRAEDTKQNKLIMAEDMEENKLILAECAARTLSQGRKVLALMDLVDNLNQQLQISQGKLERTQGELETTQGKLEIVQGKLETLELNLAEFMKTVEEQMPRSVASTPTAAQLQP